LIAKIINRCGGRWEDWEDDLTIPRLNAMFDEWGQEPPIAPFVAAYFGFKPKQTVVNAHEIFEMFPSGEIRLN
jgi:hypothetical protein